MTFQGSDDRSDSARLSAGEVEELLKSATLHRQANHRNLRQKHPSQGKQSRYSQQQETELDGADPQRHPGHHGNNMTKNRFTSRGSYVGSEHRSGHKENQGETQEDRANQSNHGNRGNHNDIDNSSHREKNCVLENWAAGHPKNRVGRGGGNGGPLPRWQSPEVLSPQQPQLCYTPTSYIPLSDYVSVDEDELFCFSPDGSTATAVYSGHAHPDRAPSPLYAEDTPYTILHSVDATEPITAIFMGFQLTQDDSGHAPECEASLKAELIIIDGDSDDETKETRNQPGTNGCQAGRSAVGDVLGGGDRRTHKQVATGMGKIKKKHQACCAVC